MMDNSIKKTFSARRYEKPEIKRIDLAMEETLSAGCKLVGTECTDPFPGISEAGS